MTKPMADEDEDGDWDRVVLYSQVFDRTEAIKALILAIRCGIESALCSEARPLPTHGDIVKGSFARVNEKGMVWANLPSDFVIDYWSFPTMGSQSFYLLRNLGRGSSGRAFLACNSAGKACVAKFFLLDLDTLHRQEGTAEARRKERDRLLEEKKRDAEAEMKYWAGLYGDKYKVQVRKLHDHWCLMLPYFEPVRNEARIAALPDIRNILEKCKKKGLQYNNDDLRWRHVGIRNGEICLFDLGSLEPWKGTIKVDDQIRFLESKINKE